MNVSSASILGSITLYKNNKMVTLEMYSYPEVAKLYIPESYLPANTVNLIGAYRTSDWKYYPAQVRIETDGTIVVNYFTSLNGSATVATDGYIIFSGSWYTT